jgi:peptide/nickel transport system permease protein
MREELHSNARVPEQYAVFLWRLVAHQSLGPTPVVEREGGALLDSAEVAREPVPATLSLVVPALLLAAGVGLLVGGALARVRWRRIFDLPIYVGVGLSPIFVGLILSYVAFKRDISIGYGYCEFFNPPPPRQPDETVCGGALDWATHLVLPVIALSLYFAAVYTRVVRGLVVQVRGELDPEVRRKRRRRSSFLFARSVGRDFGFAISVGLFVESVFGIPGLGYSIITSIAAASVVETQAYVLYATFLAISIQFVVDLVVAALDPSLRWAGPVAREPNRT